MAAVYIIERFRVCDYPLASKKVETIVKKHIKKMLKTHRLEQITIVTLNDFKLSLINSYGRVELWKLELLQSEFDELEVMCSYEYSRYK